MLHDILDKKYVTDAQAADPYAYFQPFFTSMAASHGVDLRQDGRDQIIAKITSSVSWTTEKKLRDSGEWTEWHDTCLELHCVQDADRLDAIGAFGKYLNLNFPISYNFVYRNLTLRSLQYRQEAVNSLLELSVLPGLPLSRPLHTPTDDADHAHTAIQHFHDKLLNVHDRLKTEAGKKMGDRRHKFVSTSFTMTMKNNFHSTPAL